MLQLLRHLRRAGDGAGDLGAQRLGVTLAQPMHGHLHRALALAELRRNGGVWNRAAITGERDLELLQLFSLASSREFRAQLFQNLIEQGQRPATLEQFLRRLRVARLQAVTLLGGLRVDGNVNVSAAAFSARNGDPIRWRGNV